MINSEKTANLYERAFNYFRNQDFDNAMQKYDQILDEVLDDGAVYWNRVLCRFGIVYVEDPRSQKRVPTITRTQIESVLSNQDYKDALEHSNSYQRLLYEEEAKLINKIQKKYLEISQNEEPYDVFICYKDSISEGTKTPGLSICKANL